jgi:carboxyl-terminal processing protease
MSFKVAQDARAGPSSDAVLFPSAEVEFANGIAVIRIRCFAKATSQILSSRLAAVLDNPAVALRGLVLDVRDNPGGNITSMAAVADLFMDRGTIVSFDARNPRDRFSITATAKSEAYQRVPMVVLINGRTISAAEVLAAALQGNGRAVVIGTSSYGKGIAQSQILLPNGGRLWLSSAQMSAPAGYLLHYHGVVPDVCTTLSEDDRESYQSAIERPRGSLTEIDWKILRQACPQAPDRDAIDRDLVEIATRVLSRF